MAFGIRTSFSSVCTCVDYIRVRKPKTECLSVTGPQEGEHCTKGETCMKSHRCTPFSSECTSEVSSGIFFYYNPHAYFSRMTTGESLILSKRWRSANIMIPTINLQQVSNTKELVIPWLETAWLWEERQLSTNSCFLLPPHNQIVRPRTAEIVSALSAVFVFKRSTLF